MVLRFASIGEGGCCPPSILDKLAWKYAWDSPKGDEMTARCLTPLLALSLLQYSGAAIGQTTQASGKPSAPKAPQIPPVGAALSPNQATPGSRPGVVLSNPKDHEEVEALLLSGRVMRTGQDEGNGQFYLVQPSKVTWFSETLDGFKTTKSMSYPPPPHFHAGKDVLPFVLSEDRLGYVSDQGLFEWRAGEPTWKKVSEIPKDATFKWVLQEAGALEMLEDRLVIVNAGMNFVEERDLENFKVLRSTKYEGLRPYATPFTMHPQLYKSKDQIFIYLPGSGATYRYKTTNGQLVQLSAPWVVIGKQGPGKVLAPGEENPRGKDSPALSQFIPKGDGTAWLLGVNGEVCFRAIFDAQMTQVKADPLPSDVRFIDPFRFPNEKGELLPVSDWVDVSREPKSKADGPSMHGAER